MTAVAASNGAKELGDPAELVDGFSAAFIGAAVIAVVGAVAAAFIRRPAPAPVEPVRQAVGV